MKQYFKDNWKSILIKILIVVAIITADLLTKVYFSKTTGEINFIPDFITFEYVENTGAAYGIFGNSTIFLVIITFIFIIGFIAWDIYNKEKNIWSLLGFSFIVGGAIGNLVDRLAFGYVRDFIKVNGVKLFGVFNIADAFITIGCVCYIIYMVLSFIKERKRKN